MSIILHINRIDVCDAYHLKLAYPMPDNESVLISDYMPWKKICMIGLANVEIADKVENGLRTWNTKFTATLSTRFPISSVPQSFRLTDVKGNTFLIGLGERPFPIVNQTTTHNSDIGSKTACLLTVSWTAICPMLAIRD